MSALKRPTVHGVAGLVQQGLVAPEMGAALKPVAEAFNLRLTPEVLAQISSASLEDPIFAQYVPQAAELTTQGDELADPIGDELHEKVKGIVHRYPDRVLLKPTQTCAVYCRFCFRREKVGQNLQGLNTAELDEAISYIANHHEINEVILTGGDPLVLSTRRLRDVTKRLAAIEHVCILRWHSRVPLVEPTRITGELVQVLRLHPASHMVIHINHPAELSAPVAKALALLVDGGIPLFSQSVLLNGVNDDEEILRALFQKLVQLRVKPYYLHHLDKARGTSHFRVSLAKGQALMVALRGRISGLALPSYVLDIPGGFGKVPIGVNHVSERSPGQYEITDPWGQRHDYRET